MNLFEIGYLKDNEVMKQLFKFTRDHISRLGMISTRKNILVGLLVFSTSLENILNETVVIKQIKKKEKQGLSGRSLLYTVGACILSFFIKIVGIV